MAKGVDKFNPAWYNKDKGKIKQQKERGKHYDSKSWKICF